MLSGTTDPGATDPGTTDPGTTDPGTTDPATTDPATTDPGTTGPGTTGPGTIDPGTTDGGVGTPLGNTVTGFYITGPAHNSVIYLDQTEGDIFISGSGGTNPNNLTITLEVWSSADSDAPMSVTTIATSSSGAWSVNIGRVTGTYYAAVLWAGMPAPDVVVGIARTVDFTVEAYGGDPIPT